MRSWVTSLRDGLQVGEFLQHLKGLKDKFESGNVLVVARALYLGYFGNYEHELLP